MDNIFDTILDNDEKIVKVMKPNKFMMYFKTMFWSSIYILFMFGFVIFGMLMSFLDEEVSVSAEEKTKTILITLGIAVAVIVAILLIEWLFLHLYYKNVFYGYTNKRLVIRKGIFGVDYKSLDIKMIGASTVNVSFFDKILKKNTGTIQYGSMANPMNGANTINNFVFSHITDPYGVYKEVKNYISDTNSPEEKTTAVKKDKKPATKRKASTGSKTA